MDAIDLLYARRTTPGAHPDRKVAVVLPGGGMRGAWQAGALEVLQSTGLAVHVDVVVGSSVGALNGAYFAAGQARKCVHAHLRWASTWRFCNPLRPWKVLDVGWLVEDVMGRRVPVDRAALADDVGPQLLVVVTDLETGRPRVVSGGSPHVLDALHASAAVPLLYGRAPEVDGRRAMDGGLSAPVPYPQAVAAGATDLLVVAPTPRGARWQRQDGAVDWLFEQWSHLRSPTAGVDCYRQAPDRFDTAMAAIEAADVQQVESCRTVFFGEGSSAGGRTVTDDSRMLQLVELGRDEMRRLLSGSNVAPGC